MLPGKESYMNPRHQPGQADHMRFYKEHPGSQGAALEMRNERPK